LVSLATELNAGELPLALDRLLVNEFSSKNIFHRQPDGLEKSDLIIRLSASNFSRYHFANLSFDSTRLNHIT
jgi:hypothetical protein